MVVRKDDDPDRKHEGLGPTQPGRGKGGSMFVLGNFIMALAKLLDIGLTLYMWIIIARALVSWVNPDPYNRIVVFLYRSTEPVLAPLRRWLPFFRGMGIDLSPVIAIAVIIFLQSFLLKSMMELTLYLR